ncbi:hypothetical protein CRG98_021377 [Punica granatum]|uniref:Uncharacterized protein n=1 Tax=Punica granatum TaxID=22663 RepID=A0A2I0JQP5_PUNGR|nr:hypothetical protein CRG98_021377 [Punica granatum]
MQIQDMLLEAVNFTPVTRNGQKRLLSLIGSIQDSFLKTTTTATSGSELAVGSHWPCSNIPSGASVATSDPTCASRDFTGRPDNSGNKRPPRSPKGVPWLPKAAVLASKFHREPLWRHPTRLVPIGSVQYSSRVYLVPFGSVQRKTAQTRPINGSTRILKSRRTSRPGKGKELTGFPPREVTECSLAPFGQGMIFLTRSKFDSRVSSYFLTCMSMREMIRNETGKPRGTPFEPWDLSAISKEK